MDNRARRSALAACCAALSIVAVASLASAHVVAGDRGFPVTLTMDDPGVGDEGSSYPFGIEALIPANKAAGPNRGVIAQLHVFLDDLFPNTLGRPLFP